MSEPLRPVSTRVPDERREGQRNTVADRLRTELRASQATEKVLEQTLQLETSLITTSATDIENVIRAEETLQVAEARRNAEAIYQTAIASADGAYRVALTEAIKRLEHGMTRASATFEAAASLANTQAERILAPAKSAYDRQVDLAIAARHSVIAPAAAEYTAATRRLVEEFGQDVRPVRDAYDRQLKEAADARAHLQDATAAPRRQNSRSASAAS